MILLLREEMHHMPRLRSIIRSLFSRYGDVGGLPLSTWRLQLFSHPEDFSGQLAPDLRRFLMRELGNRWLHTPLSLPKEWPSDRTRSSNHILTYEGFWRQVAAERVLHFTPDTVLCSTSLHSVSDFDQYDWVGAPWIWAQGTKDTTYSTGGNGMLSLRSRSVMHACCRKFAYDGRGNEDMWYIKHLQNITLLIGNQSTRSVLLAPPAVGRLFAVEEWASHADQTGKSSAPFGVVYGMRTVPGNLRAEILEACPEARLLAGYLPGASWVIDPMRGDNQCDNPKMGTDGRFEPPCPIP